MKGKDLVKNKIYSMNIHPSGIKYNGSNWGLHYFIDMETGKFIVLNNKQLNLLKGEL